MERGTCLLEGHPGAIRVCQNQGASRRLDRVSAARTRSPQVVPIHTRSHPKRTTLLPSDLVPPVA